MFSVVDRCRSINNRVLKKIIIKNRYDENQLTFFFFVEEMDNNLTINQNHLGYQLAGQKKNVEKLFLNTVILWLKHS